MQIRSNPAPTTDNSKSGMEAKYSNSTDSRLKLSVGAEFVDKGAEATEHFYQEAFSAGQRCGGYICTRGSKVKFHVSGTTADGKYVPPHQVLNNGAIVFKGLASLEVEIRSIDTIVRLLNLKQKPGLPNVYTRHGFSGTYTAFRDQNGVVSVLYSGGQHVSGVNCGVQLFKNGKWKIGNKSDLLSFATRNLIKKEMPLALPQAPDRMSAFPNKKSVITFAPSPTASPSPSPLAYPSEENSDELLSDDYEFDPTKESITKNNPALAKIKEELRPMVKSLGDAQKIIFGSHSYAAEVALDAISKIKYRKDKGITCYQKQKVLQELFFEEISPNDDPVLYFHYAFHASNGYYGQEIAERAINLIGGLRKDGTFNAKRIAERIEFNNTDYLYATRYWLRIMQKRGQTQELKDVFKQSFGKPMLKTLVPNVSSHDGLDRTSEWILMEAIYGKEIAGYVYDFYYRRPTTRGIFGPSEYDLVEKVGKVNALDENGTTWKYEISNPERLDKVQQAFNEFYGYWKQDSLTETIKYRYSRIPKYGTCLGGILNAVEASYSTKLKRYPSKMTVEVNSKSGHFKITSRSFK